MRNGIIADVVCDVENRKLFVAQQFQRIFQTDRADEIDEGSLCIFFKKRIEMRMRIVCDFDDFRNVFAKYFGFLQLRENL